MEPNPQRPRQFPLKAVIVGLVMIAVGICGAAIGMQQKLIGVMTGLGLPMFGGVGLIFVALVVWLASRRTA